MSIRNSVLALLAQGPRYGALLKTEFEERTGGPLNVGQVYTTLARLERDGLVVGDGRPDDEGRIAYRLTETGRLEAKRWWSTPVDRPDPDRDELVMKLALAVADPTVDALLVIQVQRTATMQRLHELTRRKIQLEQPGATPSATPSERLVLEHRLFTVEAELRWLDHVEATLLHSGRPRPDSNSHNDTDPTTTGETP